MMLDLNNFKPINDVLGHDVGDEALRTAARLFCSCIGETDFIARIGGDEFCIISDIVSEYELAQLSERIRMCLLQFNETNSHPYRLSVSMGYAVYDREAGMTLAEFKRHIDSLMYSSKHSQRSEQP
jgi:diguanylate cyclase (GGDEF)-like protein